MKKKIGSTYFNDELVYDGNDLGAVYTKEKTTFRIWTLLPGKYRLIYMSRARVTICRNNSNDSRCQRNLGV